MLIRGSQNLELPARKRFYSFRLYEKNQKYPKGLRPSGLRGRFKALSKKISAKLSGGTCRTRLFAQNSGVKALNRCEVRALQRKELERRLKEKPYSFADSRLWLGGNGKWKAEKGYLGDNQERFIQIERLLACGIRLFFQLMKSRLIKKDLFSVYYGNAFLPCQTNVQLPFSNTVCYCELAVQQLFFETSQSCVCTAAPLSHRFKAFSPPFCAKKWVRLVPSESSPTVFPAEL